MRLNGKPDRTVKNFCQHAEIVTLADDFVFVFTQSVAEIKLLAFDFGNALIFVGASVVERMDI